MSTKEKTPAGLNAAGCQLWRSVVDDYELGAHEALVLLEACRVSDRLDRLAIEAAGAPVTIVNVKGDVVTNPVLIEARMQAITLSRLIASLRLPSGEEEGRPQRRGAARAPYGVRRVAG